MYLIIKRSKYDTQKDSFTVVNDECFTSLDSANSYAMHLGDSEKRKTVTYTVIKLGE
tara:strand:- start:749 stop:919 length:171 start_codon:yes stop_codon:yes gene_type:complete